MTEARAAQVRAAAEAHVLRARARTLYEVLYPQWYAHYRGGAQWCAFDDYRSALGDAYRLCQTWDDARLKRLAKIVLTTDDPYIASTDRGWKIFCRKASWADDRLCQAERGELR